MSPDESVSVTGEGASDLHARLTRVRSAALEGPGARAAAEELEGLVEAAEAHLHADSVGHARTTPDDPRAEPGARGT